jgi:glycosyltransferase involved in cell wall biosynthesis
MKILHVAEVTHGGVVSLVRTFADLQVAAGHDVHVLVRPEVDQVAGTRHTWTPVRRSPRDLVAAEATLRRVVRDTRPDVVHLHSFFPGLLGRLRPLPPGPAVVYQPHSFAFAAVPPRLAWAVTVAERRGSRHTDRMVTNCHDEHGEGAARGVRTPTTVIGLPVDITHFAPTEQDRASVRADLGLTADFVAVCVGRLSRQKGQRALAAAWEAAQPKDSVLVLVGPGDPQEISEAAPTTTGRSLLLTGPQDDVRPWLWAASVSVLPSLYEGQSVAMAEALACGVPVVMTDVNGAREAICPDGAEAAGAVVPVGDMTGLLAQLERRRVDRQLLAVEEGLARSRAEEMFHPDRVMARLQAGYADAISQARQRSSRRTR